jgi:hypothetical protein
MRTSCARGGATSTSSISSGCPATLLTAAACEACLTTSYIPASDGRSTTSSVSTFASDGFLRCALLHRALSLSRNEVVSLAVCRIATEREEKMIMAE